MAPERDAARLRIARAGLTQTAVEHVSRACFARMPITLVDRARSQLRSFFSDGPWSFADDAALSGLVGPGSGWTEEELAPGIRLSYGWRSSAFRIEIAAEPALEPTGTIPGASASASASDGGRACRGRSARSATRSKTSCSSSPAAVRRRCAS